MQLRGPLLLVLVVLSLACGGGDEDDESGWVEVGDVPERSELFDVWAFAPDDVRIAADQGVILRFDGSTWTSEQTPSTYAIRGLWGLAPDDLWACSGPSIMHYDGAAWSIVADTTMQGLAGTAGIYASGAGDVWVAGDDGFAVHWDGSTLTASNLPDSNSNHIFGTGPDDVWVTSTFATSHYDGVSWVEVDDPQVRGGTGVWGSAPDDLWFADERGSVMHYDGTTFEEVEPAGRFVGDMAALWGTAADQVWSVGTAGSIARWDGSEWNELEHQRIGSPQLRVLSAVHGSSPDNVWAIGTVYDDDGVRPIIHRSQQ